MKWLLQLLLLALPWAVRRRALAGLLGFELHPAARIGLSLIGARRVSLAAGASIGHLNVVKGLDLLVLEEQASIGRGNWISGFPSGPSPHYAHQPERSPALVVGRHAAITHRHIIDCTAQVHVGAYSTVAGYGSQILTHSIDLALSRQHAADVHIGCYCFVGTACVLLGGSALPDRSVLGAASVLNRAHEATHTLYAGVPARAIKSLPAEWAYFRRPTGFVY